MRDSNLDRENYLTKNSQKRHQANFANKEKRVNILNVWCENLRVKAIFEKYCIMSISGPNGLVYWENNWGYKSRYTVPLSQANLKWGRGGEEGKGWQHKSTGYKMAELWSVRLVVPRTAYWAGGGGGGESGVGEILKKGNLLVPPPPPNSGRGKIVGAGRIFCYRFFKRRLDKKGSFCEGVDEFTI